eukprot:TRINITY_DN3365_c1_g1_i1.p1 TRINITY_DN3365_c1_g1~~TRINITY_DN3365_c1_g1_i1.p1  ORF type:complete len:362 (+),score=60.42 TRINITY_DN3365_c1_g1_i1:96-1088(+)
MALLKKVLSQIQRVTDLIGNLLPATAGDDIVGELRACGMEVGYEEVDTLRLFEGSFYQSVDAARCCSKPLLAYIHSSGHPQAVPFVKQALSASHTVDLIKNHFVFWAATANSEQGHICASSIVGTSYPLAAVLYPHKVGSGIVVLKIEGHIDSGELCRRLTESLETCRQVTDTQRTNAQNAAERERLRSEQRRELQEAIATDLRRQALDNPVQQTEQEAPPPPPPPPPPPRDVEPRIAVRGQLPVEPPPGPDVSILKITLPTGEFIHRRYHRSDPLQLVYDTVTAHSSYTGNNFHISTTFPVRRLSPTSTLEECDLFPRAAVVVHEVDDV